MFLSKNNESPGARFGEAFAKGESPLTKKGFLPKDRNRNVSFYKNILSADL